MQKPLTEYFGEFILKTSYNELPKDVVHQTKRCILDFFGVALGGNNVGLSPLATKFVFDMGGEKEATVIGDGRKIPALNAALVNGVKGHALDMDDGHRFANAHPGVAIIPAAVAIGEKEDVSGKDLIEGIVVGYETFLRIAINVNPSHLQRGFHTTGTVGPFGAAAACGKILKLNKVKIKNALSISGLLGSGLLEVMTSGEMMKPLHAGRAAQAGLMASLLAKEGAEGPNLMLEGEKGFFKAFSGLMDFSNISGDIGSKFEIMNAYFKRHAACRHIHPTLDALIEIMDRENIGIDEIRAINVDTYSIAYQLTGQNNEAKTELAAKFSLPVSVALALVYRRAGINEYSMEHIGNPLVLDLAKKIRITADKERDKLYPQKRGSSVKIETLRGAYTHEVDIPKGEPELPFSDDELSQKFFENTPKALSQEKAITIRRTIFNIENERVKNLMTLFS